MKRIKFLVQKELLQILRNRAMLPMIIVMPVIQLLVLANAATYEIKNLNVYFIDHDGSKAAQILRGQFEASPYFQIVGTHPDRHRADKMLEYDRTDVVIEVPEGFERHLLRDSKSTLHLKINAINGVKAGVAVNYANSIILDFNQDYRRDNGAAVPKMTAGQIDIEYMNWFNPSLNYKTFMVPGILVMLVTMVGLFLTGMNIVREKEIGTIEQINVTPLRKHEFVIGKMLPFWLIGMVELALGMAVGFLVFKIPVVGSPVLVFMFATVYMFVVMGIGLFISTTTETQQQALFFAWFFMAIFILMSGLFTPIESMPVWAQRITDFNPVAYFVRVNRMVILKGAGWAEIQEYVYIMLGYAAAINALAVWNYRKKS
ncbi:MAG: ABC transporter permease [Bacteroidia bacterium]